MPFFGIYFRFLPHTYGMNSENRQAKPSGIVLSPTEAEEYCEFKRQKRIAEVAAALSKANIYAAQRDAVSGEQRKAAESAKRVKAASVQVNPVYVSSMKSLLGVSGPEVDCVVGGTGETLPKAKAYEAKLAVKSGAKEITLILCGSLLRSGRTGDIKREIKRVCRAARKAVVKVAADSSFTYADFLRAGRLAADCGAKFLSVRFFPDCGRLKRDLHDVCMLEVTEVETASDYKALIAAGVERIGTSHAEEIYSELMKEAENLSFAVDFTDSVTVSVPPKAAAAPPVSETSEKSETAVAAESSEPSKQGEKPKAEQMSVLNDKKMLDGALLK